VDVPQVQSPIRFADAQVGELAPPPLLGQHSDAILAELGYDAATITALRAAGAI
jgi:crotonobetainyl-CoA:carnitine CoA-transferase CaiB-like acyl-CoA transferase